MGELGTSRLTIDDLTRALLVTNTEELEIHEGEHYYISGFLLINTDVEIVFGVTTPDSDTVAHVSTNISGTSQIEVYIYEDSTFTGGTPIVGLNNNRNSSKLSEMILVGSPTVTDIGDSILAQSAGKAGVNPLTGSSGLTEQANKIMLKKNTKYIFKTISKDDGNIITYRADWSDHISK